MSGGPEDFDTLACGSPASLSPGARADVRAYLDANPGVRIRSAFELSGRYRRHGPTCWYIAIPDLTAFADAPGHNRSLLVLLESGRLLGPPHIGHESIQGGAYSHWGRHLFLSSSDNSDPGANGRRYVVMLPQLDIAQSEGEPLILPRPFLATGGHRWTIALPGTERLSDASGQRRSFLQVLEDGRPLGPAHAYHEHIGKEGRGAFSHWRDSLYFSTSDNSDPNRNERRYEVVHGARRDEPAWKRQQYLDRWYQKRELLFQDPAALWDMHPDGAWFRNRGGEEIPPPIYGNIIGLTSFCNLKCTICGSQEAIDHEKVARRSMSPEVLTSVSETIFPFLIVVILASLGEPTIYPHFNQALEAAYRWGASIKLESNATALTPRMIELLTSLKGELFFSIDATGDLFEKVRVNAKWEKVDANIRALMAARDPAMTKVNLYPTISRRTLPDMLNVARWGLDVGIEEITFHSYDPTMFAKEERPLPEEFAQQNERIREWLDVEARVRDLSSFSVKVNGVEINPHHRIEVGGQYPLAPLPKNHPISMAEYATHTWRCSTPRQNVDIGPDGQIYPCVWSGARPQDNTMGYATSKEAFADAWFGSRYVDLRNALQVGSTREPNVAQCASCLKRYALSGDRMV